MELHNPTKRVIDILNIISKNSDKLTFSNISKNLEIPKSTLSPILKTFKLRSHFSNLCYWIRCFSNRTIISQKS